MCRRKSSAMQSIEVLCASQNFEADDLSDAVKISAERTQKGGKCVMSPAAASYGYFKNFEERGKTFKNIVNSF